MRGFLVCGFEELPGFLTRAAIAELTGGSALMEKEYVQAEAYAEEYARGLPVATGEPIMGEVVGEVVPSATDHLPEALDGAPRLALVAAGSADALRFDHADVLRAGGEAPLSANGKHVGLYWPQPRNAWGHWDYIDLCCSDRVRPLRVKLELPYIIFYSREHGEFAFDVAMWKLHEGTHLVAVKACAGNPGGPTRMSKDACGRDFVLHADGTIGPRTAQHLRFGVYVPKPPGPGKPCGPGWSAHQNIDMCGQGDVEIIHNWRATHSIEDLQRIVEQKGYSAFTVSSGEPSFDHAALKRFPYQLTAGHCKPITTCCNHPCTIYIWSGGGAAEGPAAEIYKPPGSGATEDGPKLVLTSKGSSSALYFENAAGLHQKGGALLTLRGGNMAVVPRYDYPRDAGEWSYIELGLGPRGMAMRVRLDGEFLVRVHDERVFDIAHWKYEEGNNLVILRSSTFHPDHTRKAPGGRSFVVNPDGTISPKFAQHLVLGGQQPTFSFVPAESPLVCRFRRAEALAAGKKVPLRLASHPGLAVVQVFDKPREAHHEWHYKTLGIGPASKAVVASRQESFFVDKAGWYVCPSGLKVHKGNHTDLVANRYIHPARIQEEHRKRGEERPLEYEFHADGSVAPASAPHLRLGCSCPPAAAASGKSNGSACCVVS